MYLNLKKLKMLIVCISTSVFWGICFVGIFVKEYSVFTYIFIQQILAGFLLYKICYLMKKCNENKHMPVIMVSLLVACLYYLISSLKYLIVNVSPGLITDNKLRLLGSVIVFISIWIALIIASLKYKNNNYYKYQNYNIDIMDYSLSPFLIYGMNILYGMYIIWYHRTHLLTIYDGYRPEYTRTLGTVVFLLDGYLYFDIFVTCYYFDWKKKKTWIPLLLLLFFLFYDANESGSRGKLICRGIIILYLFLNLNKIKFKYVYKMILFFPTFFTLFSILVFQISGRVEYHTMDDISKSIVTSLAYRFDYSDLCMTIMKNTSYCHFDFSELKDAFYNVVPNYFIQHKKEVNPQSYWEILKASGLIAGYDYGESYFSMGATMFGIGGMLFVFPVLICLFDLTDKALTKKGMLGLIGKTMIGWFVFNGETVWHDFFVAIRNCILYLIIIFIIYKILFQLKIIELKRRRLDVDIDCTVF